MYIIGITGGVGAGKSQILEYFQEHYGARVIQADRVGHLVMEPGTKGYQAITEKFGTAILREDKTIDRGILGTLVFADAEKLKELNAIVHPAVKEWILRETDREQKAGRSLLVIEAALLIEDRYDEICDEIWYIYTREEVRRARLKASRGYSDEKIDSILRSQLKDSVFREHCRVVIDNSNSLEYTYRQIDERIGERQI